MKAPAGTQVGLYVDMRVQVHPGDFIQTRTGRIYLIDTVRVQATGKWAGRQHLFDFDDVVHRIWRYSR